MKTIAVILAAGQGTRMCSNLAKVLHPLLGSPLIEYPLQLAEDITGTQPVVVVGHQEERIRELVEDCAIPVHQEPQLGTGHALKQAESVARGLADQVLVLPGDMPLLSDQTISQLVRTQESNEGPLSMLILKSEETRGFGRVLRDSHNQVIGIVEEAVASPEELAIREFNSGVYCFKAEWLWENLPRIVISQKGEYFLTDLVEIAVKDGHSIQSIVSQDSGEFIGINTRVDLADAEAYLRRKINNAHMLAGVTIIDPVTTYIEPQVRIGKDTIIWPNTHLRGKTVVGEACEVGPNTIIHNSQVGGYCKVLASVLEFALLEDHVEIGPFGHLRKGAHLASGVHMGNFGEVKNSYLAPGVKMGHFSYIGDAQVGRDVNIGAGTITCNYGLDGKKRKTEIGDGAFIGSDTLLVAPVKIGEGAATGSGAVVTKDVPPETLAVGMPARAIRKR